jgi:hypothetical protein
MFAEALFVFSQKEGVWSVEEDVPFRRHDGYVIFVADPISSTVTERRVELGLRESGRVELLGSGPIEGPVVTMGQHLLSDGQSYRLPEPDIYPAGGSRGGAPSGARPS